MSKLHPQVAALFATLKSFGAPPMHSLPVAEARASYERASAMLGGPVVEMASVEDRMTEGPAGDLPVRIYRPLGLAEGPAPALIYFHGGGWVIGSVASHDKVCRQMAAAAGCVVLSVEYRLGPEAPVPAAQEDALAAVAWVVAHASELGLDAARLAVGGDSAGGSMAAMTAIAARDTGLKLRAQVLIYPSVDGRPMSHELYPSRTANAGYPFLEAATMLYFLKHSGRNPSHADDWRLSVMIAEDLAGVAPVLMVTAGLDVLHDEGVAYAARLQAAGVEVLRWNLPGLVHGYLTMGGALGAVGETVALVGMFLRQRLV